MIIRIVAGWPGAHRYMSTGPNGKKKDILFDECAYRLQAAQHTHKNFSLVTGLLTILLLAFFKYQFYSFSVHKVILTFFPFSPGLFVLL